MGERAQEGLSGGAMPSVSRAPCWVGFQWVGVEWGTRQLGRRNIQGSKEGWACSAPQQSTHRHGGRLPLPAVELSTGSLGKPVLCLL